MKKLFLLLILAVACLFGVTSCGKEEEATPSQPQEQELTDQEKLDKAYSYLKQYYMNANNVTKNSYNVIANVPNATLTWSLEVTSGDQNAVSLGTEKVTINKVEYYEVTISQTPSAETFYKLTATVSVGSLSKQMVYERSVPAVKEGGVTIADLVANKPTGNLDEVFEVTGIWTAKDGMAPASNTYGNGFLSDEEGNKITIYGLSGTEACLSFDEATGVYKYSNSKDFPTLGINDGAVLKVKMVYTVQYDNYSAYLVEIISNGAAGEVDPEPAKVNTTIADLVANAPADEKALIYVVTGIWTGDMAAESNTYGNGKLKDEAGNEIVVYGFSESESCVTWGGTMYAYANTKNFPTLGIEDGAIVTVGMLYTPKFDNYSIYLISKDGQGDVPTVPTPTEPAPTLPADYTVADILAVGATLADQEKIAGTLTITGTITEITAEYSDQYKNISFMLTDGTAEILVFRSKGDCAAELKVGDKVKVEGEVINYAGTIEFQYAALTLVEAGGTDEPVEPTPTVPVEGDPQTETTIAALVASKPTTDADMVYIVEGIWTTGGVANSANKYGNGTLIDEAGNSVAIYGFSSSKEACLTYANNKYTYKNPQDFGTMNLAEYTIVKVGMVYTKQFDNYSIYLIEVVGPVSDAAAVGFDKANLKLDSETAGDLNLPIVGRAGSTIAWASSNVDVIETDGSVTRPAAGSEDAEVTLTATITKGNETVTATFVVTVKAEIAQTGESQLLATFTFGANGSATHADGSEIAAGKTYNADGYALKIDTTSKVYDGARDAKGNSALKLGTSKVIGEFSFTVSSDVNKVVIYVAQYKTNATKVNVNGVDYTISTSSNNGEYTAIEIDTTTTKTITFKTVATTYRAMIDTIEFHS